MNSFFNIVKYSVFSLLISYFLSGCYSNPQPTESELGDYTEIEFNAKILNASIPDAVFEVN